MKVLVVSPHPDDETLGAAGTLIKMKKTGNEIFWLNITDMTSKDGFSEDRIQQRQEQIKNVTDHIGFDAFYNFQLCPTKLSELSESILIEKIKVVFDLVKPQWIILPGKYDAHSDHRVVYDCCMACTKSFRAPYIRRVTTMEVLSETEFGFQEETFKPNLFIDISEELDDKLTAVKFYNTEIEAPPFPRSIERIKALASYRGGQASCRYAEAFQIIKQIE